MRYKGTPIDKISLFATPQLYLELTVLLVKDWLYHMKELFITRGVVIAGILMAWIIVANVGWFQVINVA